MQEKRRVERIKRKKGDNMLGATSNAESGVIGVAKKNIYHSGGYTIRICMTTIVLQQSELDRNKNIF